MAKTILSKLSEIQATLDAPKTRFNSFGKYSYRSCEDILGAVKPLLKDQGLVILINDDITYIEGRFYVKATATLYDIETGESLYCSALAREAESKTGSDSAQITGACSSYARKYALNALFAIDDIKDADTDESAIEAKQRAETDNKAPAKTAKAKKADDKEQARAKYNELIAYCSSHNHNIKDVAKAFALNANSTAKDFETAIAKLVFTDAKRDSGNNAENILEV